MALYNYGKSLDKNWTSGTWKVLLVTSSYTPDPDHHFVSTPVANEATGSGYVRKTLSGQAVSIDLVNDRADHNADNITWSAMTSSFRYAIVFLFGTNDADSILHSYFDLGAQSIAATDFTVKWNAAASNGTVFRGT